MSLEKFHVAICIPTSGFCRTRTAVCLTGLLAHTMCHYVKPGVTKEQSCVIRIAESSVVSQNREQLVMESLDNGATHILFIDDDMEFPADGMQRLAQHELPIVGCNYLYRQRGHRPTAQDFDDKPVPIEESSVGTREVKLMGFGFCLIERRVFEAMPHPWFGIYWNQNKNKFTTEDAPFMNHARELGFRSYIDQDVSKDLRHVGIFNYGWNDPVL